MRPRLAVCPRARKAAWIRGRTVPAAMRGMDPPNLGQQGTIGCLAWAFGPTAPGIIPRRRDAHHVAQDANRERLALILDDTEFHFGGSEKMRSVFSTNITIKQMTHQAA